MRNKFYAITLAYNPNVEENLQFAICMTMYDAVCEQMFY